MNINAIAYYTRFVHSAKMLLGVLVVILTALILFYPLMKKNEGLRIAFTGGVKSEKPPPTQMVNPNFRGFDESNQPYNITAKSAMQLDEDNIVFDRLNGDISLNSGAWLSVQANNGALKIKERLLSLNGAVEMFNDDGYELRTETLQVDIGRKIASTVQSVKGHGPLGKMKSEGAVFDGNTKIATFTGPVFVTLYLPPKERGVRSSHKGTQ